MLLRLNFLRYSRSHFYSALSTSSLISSSTFNNNGFKTYSNLNITPEHNSSLKPSILPKFLPDEYNCTEAWKKRLESPVLKRIELDDFFYEVDIKYQTDKVISHIDVDLFVNKATEEEHVEEIEELAHRLRKSPSTAQMLASTSHAIIRTLTNLNQTDTLIRILTDRFNYGIFLDSYLANLLMDKFLSAGNTRDAAKIASLLMFQEEYDSSTTRLFSLLSILKYLETPSPEPWEPEPIPPFVKEETKVRVKYLRNPFYDDHFEIHTPTHIIGKSLFILSQSFVESQIVKNSIELLGLAIYDKWALVDETLKKFEKDQTEIAEEVLKKVTELAKTQLSLLESSPDKSLPKPYIKQVPGMNTDDESLNKMFSRLKWDEKTSAALPQVVSHLSTAQIKTSKVDILSTTKELLQKAVEENKVAEMASIAKTYEEWESVRVRELENQIQKAKDIQRLLEIRSQKEELKEREDTIFFFDKEEEWMMKLPKEEVKEVEDDRPFVYKGRRPKKWTGKVTTTKKNLDDDYVSPII